MRAASSVYRLRATTFLVDGSLQLPRKECIPEVAEAARASISGVGAATGQRREGTPEAAEA
eukprot:7512714-Lingulodinium_polyedra.AAC.1